MKILSLFTHPCVTPNLYDCLFSAVHTFEECFNFFVNAMKVNVHA